uniref:Vacuolar protein sorting-associated protein 13 n=1 Tax=Angiostrongylus cantonensis TaxID=6313 RepID=A0A158PAL8_ANGCA
MVFESLVADLLNRFLGDFVDNLDASQLNIGIWGGDVKLENLEVKETALDDLDLPVKLKFGYLSSLVLKIPWKNLYNEPVIATIDGLYLIVVPNKGVVYDEEKTKKNMADIKQKTLARLEEARKNRRKPPDPNQDSFVEKMVTQTTDENWVPTIHRDVVKIFHKLVLLNSLSVYWNSDSDLFSDIQDKVQIRSKLKATIHNGKDGPPIKMEAKLKLNQKPEVDGTNWKIPKVDLSVDMMTLVLAIGKYQYQDILLLLEAQERFNLATQYLKYRPNINEFKGHYKKWWHFAYTAILEEKVRRRRNNWSWPRMRAHRRLVRDYRDAWLKCLTERNPSSSVMDIVKKAEENLDVFNLNVARQQAEMEVDRKGLKRVEDQPQGWLSWGASWFGGGGGGGENTNTPTTKKKDFASQFNEAMTPEEKEKLFEAIDYQENIPPTNYPKEFVENRVDFCLGEVAIIVDDAVALNFLHLRAHVEQRPSANAMNLRSTIQELKMDGDGQEMLRVRDSSKAWLVLAVDTHPLHGKYDQSVQLAIAPLSFKYHAPAVNHAVDVFKPPESVKLNQLAAAAMSRYEEVKTRSVTGLAHAVENRSRLVLDIQIQPTTIFISEGGVYNVEKPTILADLGHLSITTVEGDPNVIEEKDKLHQLMDKAYDKFRVKLSNVVVSFAENVTKGCAALADANSPMHILKPTGLDIEIHKCSIDDLRLPRIRVIGALPDILVTMSDIRVLELTRLLLSIPTPEPDPEPPSVGEVVHNADIATRAKMRTIMEAQEMETTDNQGSDPSKAEDEKSKTSEQQVQVELDLHLNQIGLVILRGDDVFCNISIVRMGCKLQLRAFDMVVMAELYSPVDTVVHLPQRNVKKPKCRKLVGMLLPWVVELSRKPSMLNIILVKHTEWVIIWTTGKEKCKLLDGQLGAVRFAMPMFKPLNPGKNCLYFIDSTKEEASLITFKLVQANPESPFFVTEYHCTEQAIEFHFRSLDISLHQVGGNRDIVTIFSVFSSPVFKEGLVELKRFAENMQNELNALQEGARKRIEETIETGARKLSRQLSARNELQHRVIKMHLESTISSLAVAFGTQSALDTLIAIENIRVGTKITADTMNVVATLRTVKMEDMTVGALYKKLLSVTGEKEMLRVELTQYQRDELQKKHMLPTDVRLAEMRFVFLNLWLCRLMAWMAPFQEQATRAAAAAQAVASEKAVEAAENVKQIMAESPPRILLDIELEAPVILLPQLSTRRNVLVFILGMLNTISQFAGRKRKLIISNHISGDKNNQKLIMDHMEVKLMDMKFGIGSVSEDASNLLAVCDILEPLSFNIAVHRNLVYAAIKDLPETTVDAQIPSLSVNMSDHDYETLMQTLTGNLAEGTELVVVPPPVHSDEVDTFSLDRISAVLHTGILRVIWFDSTVESRIFLDCAESKSSRKASSAFAALKLCEFKLSGSIKEDNSMDVAMFLNTFSMSDERRDKTKIHQLLDKKNPSDTHRFLTLAFSQDAVQNKNIRLRMSAFFICLCPEFLGSLLRFFTITKTQEQIDREMDSLGSSGTTQKLESSQTTVTNSDSGFINTALNCDMQGVEVILVENSMQPETSQALILSFNMRMEARPSQMESSTAETKRPSFSDYWRPKPINQKK